MPSASGSPPLASLGGTWLDGRFICNMLMVWSLVLFVGSVVSFVVRTMRQPNPPSCINPSNLLLFLVVTDTCCQLSVEDLRGAFYSLRESASTSGYIFNVDADGPRDGRQKSKAGNSNKQRWVKVRACGTGRGRIRSNRDT